MTDQRRRLPNRRRNETRTLAIDRMRLTATVGFDVDGRPAEVFLDGAKDGSGLAAVLADASVVISIALQHGVPACALAKSVARSPTVIDGPAIKAASPIGAALDLIAEYETQNG
jgi:ribonucleoside-diphosphate reductase alpha chain